MLAPWHSRSEVMLNRGAAGLIVRVDTATWAHISLPEKVGYPIDGNYGCHQPSATLQSHLTTELRQLLLVPIVFPTALMSR